MAPRPSSCVPPFAGSAVQLSVFIATSLDGFIARPDGGIDWLPSGSDSAEDYGYGDFIATVDVHVIGRNTYKRARSFPEWPCSMDRGSSRPKSPESTSGPRDGF